MLSAFIHNHVLNGQLALTRRNLFPWSTEAIDVRVKSHTGSDTGR